MFSHSTGGQPISPPFPCVGEVLPDGSIDLYALRRYALASPETEEPADAPAREPREGWDFPTERAKRLKAQRLKRKIGNPALAAELMAADPHCSFCGCEVTTETAATSPRGLLSCTGCRRRGIGNGDPERASEAAAETVEQFGEGVLGVA